MTLEKVPSSECQLHVCACHGCVYLPQTGSIINFKIDNWTKPCLSVNLQCFQKYSLACLRSGVHRVFHWSTQEEGTQLPNRFLFFPSVLTDNAAFLSFFLSKVPLMHFDAIWLCFCSSLWFLHFLTTFFRPCQKTILRAHVWIDMDCAVTQVFALLKLAPSQVTSVGAVQCNAPFLLSLTEAEHWPSVVIINLLSSYEEWILLYYWPRIEIWDPGLSINHIF